MVETKKSVIGLGKALVKSELPGQILQLLVSVGDEVKKGQALIILDAMKMENEVIARMDGIVKEISVNPGDNVMKDDLLISLA